MTITPLMPVYPGALASGARRGAYLIASEANAI